MKPKDIVAALNEAPEVLPAKLERKILAVGKGAIPTLRRMINAPMSSGGGDLHAIKLLANMGATEAIPDLVAALERAERDEKLTEAATKALEALGPAAIEPLLASACDVRAFLIARAEILANLKVRDPRILECLLAFTKRYPDLADYIGVYGDPAAIPTLSEMLDQASVKKGRTFFSEVTALALTIEQLGGVLTPEQRAKKALEEGLRNDHQQKILEMLQNQDQAGAVQELLAMLQSQPTAEE